MVTLDSNKELSPVSIGEWVSKGLGQFKISRGTIFQAMRHLTEKTIEELSSDDNSIKKRAIGKLFEAIVYESIRELIKNKMQYSLVAKGADVPQCNQTNPSIGQDGLFYTDKTGDIVARGNGQDLAEFDCLLFDQRGEIVFVESKSAIKFLGELEEKITYKKQLLRYLFSRNPQFILVSSWNIKNDPNVMRTLRGSDSFFAHTPWFNEINSFLKQKGPFEQPAASTYEGNLIQITDINTQGIDYSGVHDVCRKSILDSFSKNTKINFSSTSWIVKNIIMGQLGESSVAELLQEKAISIDENRLNVNIFKQSFGRIVLSLSMPEFRPVLYLKVKSEHIYVKLGPLSVSTFEFEKSIPKKNAASFFNWIEKADFIIEPDLMGRIFHEFMNETIAVSRRKIREVDNLRKMRWFQKMSKSMRTESNPSNQNCLERTGGEN
jgi:hypothetical protein